MGNIIQVNMSNEIGNFVLEYLSMANLLYFLPIDMEEDLREKEQLDQNWSHQLETVA